VADKVTIVGVAWAGTDDEMQAFVKRHGITFPTIRDDSGDLFARFGVPAQPAWVFVDSAGKGSRVLGAQEKDRLLARLGTLV